MKKLVLSLFALPLFACASVQVTDLNPATRNMTPRPAEEVSLYVTKAPERAYDEIFLIRADAGDSDTALKAMRKRAGELGCDGLVIAGAADRVVSSPDATGNSSVSMREGFVGTCILFK